MYILYDEESDQTSDMMTQLVAILFYSCALYLLYFKLVMVFVATDTAYQGTFALEFSD